MPELTGILDAPAPLTGCASAAGPRGPRGPQGEPGRDGADGYTPVRGVDYFTPEEIAQIREEAVEEALRQAEERFAEALTEEKTGTLLTLQKLRPGSAVTVTGVPAGAQIEMRGKNLLDLKAFAGNIFTVEGDTLRAVKPESGDAGSPRVPCRIPAGTPFVLSCRSLSDTNGLVLISNNSAGYYHVTGTEVKCTAGEEIIDLKFAVKLAVAAGASVSIEAPQIEIGKAATAYEPYRLETTEATGETQRLVPPGASVNLSRGDGGTLTASCRRDLNAVIAALEKG
ncbi:hypothetical protein [Anaerotruncus sp. DFI.9.16]|uniref:hypothetical protein n=1 Tax=Anaerotruncus sp. DFI.9.16 TaxID=2965275 RepID=UPI00210CEBE4|nr:hypothetical protein [Anaerotruncus sp. DFI.9.16]MCQ4896655.1 hypothetical protein [Anaerotruncus sp. DFI.9.16]